MKIAAIMLVLFLQAPLVVVADTPKQIHLVSDTWEGATNKDGSGLFFELARIVYEDVGIKLDYKIVPYSRSIYMVKNEEADAWVGSFYAEENFPLYPQWHIDNNRVSIVFKKNTVKGWDGETSIIGKNVVMRRDYDYDRYIDAQFIKAEVDKIKQAFGMLENGRVEFYIEAQMELNSWISANKLNMEDYKIEHFLDLKVYIAFANNDRGKYFKELWDRRMEKIYNTDSVKKLYDQQVFTSHDNSFGVSEGK